MILYPLVFPLGEEGGESSQRLPVTFQWQMNGFGDTVIRCGGSDLWEAFALFLLFSPQNQDPPGAPSLLFVCSTGSYCLHHEFISSQHENHSAQATWWELDVLLWSAQCVLVQTHSCFKAFWFILILLTRSQKTQRPSWWWDTSFWPSFAFLQLHKRPCSSNGLFLWLIPPWPSVSQFCPWSHPLPWPPFPTAN